MQEKIIAFIRRMKTAVAVMTSDYDLRLERSKRQLGRPAAILDTSMLKLDHCRSALCQACLNALQRRENVCRQSNNRLSRLSPVTLMSENAHAVENLSQRLRQGQNIYIERCGAALEKKLTRLLAVNPRSVLERGYAIVRTIPEGVIVRDSRQVKSGSTVEVLLHRGRLACSILTEE
jgi:exodeoxyribonuclease VII large subunit